MFPAFGGQNLGSIERDLPFPSVQPWQKFVLQLVLNSSWILIALADFPLHSSAVLALLCVLPILLGFFFKPAPFHCFLSPPTQHTHFPRCFCCLCFPFSFVFFSSLSLVHSQGQIHERDNSTTFFVGRILMTGWTHFLANIFFLISGTVSVMTDFFHLYSSQTD